MDCTLPSTQNAPNMADMEKNNAKDFEDIPWVYPPEYYEDQVDESNMPSGPPLLLQSLSSLDRTLTNRFSSWQNISVSPIQTLESELEHGETQDIRKQVKYFSVCIF